MSLCETLAESLCQSVGQFILSFTWHRTQMSQHFMNKLYVFRLADGKAIHSMLEWVHNLCKKSNYVCTKKTPKSRQAPWWRWWWLNAPHLKATNVCSNQFSVRDKIEAARPIQSMNTHIIFHFSVHSIPFHLLWIVFNST